LRVEMAGVKPGHDGGKGPAMTGVAVPGHDVGCSARP
jgi:hypothetical protein